MQHWKFHPEQQIFRTSIPTDPHQSRCFLKVYLYSLRSQSLQDRDQPFHHSAEQYLFIEFTVTANAVATSNCYQFRYMKYTTWPGSICFFCFSPLHVLLHFIWEQKIHHYLPPMVNFGNFFCRMKQSIKRYYSTHYLKFFSSLMSRGKGWWF